jgi:hypothetical protein
MSTVASLSLVIPDPQAQHIIAERREIVVAYLDRWSARHPNLGSYNQDKAAWLRQLEQCAGETLKPHQKNATEVLRVWHDGYLIPLADALGLRTVTEEQTVRRFLSPRGGKPVETDLLASRISQTLALLRGARARTRFVADLVTSGLMTDQGEAGSLYDEFRLAPDKAAGLARGILLAFGAFGDPGLLHGSRYPYADIILDLLRHQALVSGLTLDVHATMQALIADTVACCAAFNHIAPKVPLRRLFVDPPTSPHRIALQRALWASTQARLVPAIMEQRGCDTDEATRIRDAVLKGGFNALIDLRSGTQPGLSGRAAERHAVHRFINERFAALEPDDRQYILWFLDHVMDAMAATQAPFPLMALLRNPPSNHRRLRIGRRLWFALASVQRRRQRRNVHRKRREGAQQASTQSTPHVDELITDLANRVGLDERAVQDRLRSFITYSPIALLERERWRNAFPELQSWLRLIKWGRLPGRMPWSAILRQAGILWAELGHTEPLSSQLLQPVFNSIPKPAFFNGGQGEATAAVRQRGTVVVSNRMRLHEVWVVVHVRLALPMSDGFGNTMASEAHLLLIVDHAGSIGFVRRAPKPGQNASPTKGDTAPEEQDGETAKRRRSRRPPPQSLSVPMGAWVSPHPPGASEVALCLYQAIWHPGTQGWPIRGIPETLRVPTALANQPLDDLRRASGYLLATVDTSQERPWKALRGLTEMIEAIHEEAVPTITAAISEQERTQGRILEALLNWLHERALKRHRPAPLWESVRKHGVVMPGHDTPAAGWLLPQAADMVEVIPGGVRRQGQLYRGNTHSLPLGAWLRYREYPLAAPSHHAGSVNQGIFVERPGPDGVVLHYFYV